jgi:Bifunctional DNA primase/polymerase, N-terminal
VSVESCFVNSGRSSVSIGQYTGVIRSKPDDRKLFNVPALVGKGTNCGCTIEHGARHLIFRHSEDLRCSASKIAPGVDVRADGGYAVWWPREGFRVVSDAPVAEWPDWLVGLARGNSRASAENPTVVTSQYLPTWQEAISNHHQSASRWSREETFALYGFRNAMQRVSSAPFKKRESSLNGESYSLGRLVGAGWISLSRVVSGLEHAIRLNLNRSDEGLTFLEEHGIDFVRWKILRALHDGMARPHPKL